MNCNKQLTLSQIIRHHAFKNDNRMEGDKQNGGWYVATSCDATKIDMTFESSAIMN